MFKVGKSLIVAGLLVVVSGQAADGVLVPVVTLTPNHSKQLEPGTVSQITTYASDKAVATKKAFVDAATFTKDKTVAGAVIVKDSVVEGTKKAQELANSGLETVTTNSSKLYNYLYKLGVNGENVSTTRLYAVQGTKIAVVTAATVAVLCYAYSKVYGKEKKTITIGGDDILTVE